MIENSKKKSKITTPYFIPPLPIDQYSKYIDRLRMVAIHSFLTIFKYLLSYGKESVKYPYIQTGLHIDTVIHSTFAPRTRID